MGRLAKLGRASARAAQLEEASEASKELKIKSEITIKKTQTQGKKPDGEATRPPRDQLTCVGVVDCSLVGKVSRIAYAAAL